MELSEKEAWILMDAIIKKFMINSVLIAQLGHMANKDVLPVGKNRAWYTERIRALSERNRSLEYMYNHMDNKNFQRNLIEPK